MKSIKLTALAFAGAVALAAPGAGMAQSGQVITGSGGSAELALATFRGNANSYCIRMGNRYGGFDFSNIEVRETRGVPAYAVKGTVTCNGSQLMPREEFISRATPR